MVLYWQAVACILIAVVICAVLSRQGKDFSVLVSITVCCLVGAAALQYLKPLLSFLDQLGSLGNLDSTWMKTILKVTGLGLIGELAVIVCTDAGNGSLAKVLQLLTGAVILSLSLPLLQAVMDLVQKILGEV